MQMHMHCNKLKSYANANAYALQQAAAAVLQAVGIYLCSSPFLYLCSPLIVATFSGILGHANNNALRCGGGESGRPCQFIALKISHHAAMQQYSHLALLFTDGHMNVEVANANW